MSKCILWLDNDTALTDPYAEELRGSGYETVVTPTVSGAEQELGRKHYDLVILDVMVPTVGPDEEVNYPPMETEQGYRTGFVFYRRFHETFRSGGTKVLVTTARSDSIVRDQFRGAGLPNDCVVTKLELREAALFLAKVQSLLGES